MNPVVVLVAASVLWGCSWWPLKQLADLGVTGLPQTLVSFGSMALLLLPVLILQRARWRPDWRLMIGIFVIGGAADLAFAWSLIYGEVIRVMVLFYLLPVWGVLGGRVFLGEKIDGQRLLAMALAIGGAFLVLGGMTIFAAPPSWIDVVAIAAGFLFAMNNVCFRAAQAAPVASKVAAMFVGAGLLAAVLVGVGSQPMPVGIPASTWLLVIATGLFLLVATAGSQYGVTHMESGRSSVLLILELIAAVITAAWWAGETMNGIEWLGGAMILAAAVLEAWRPTEPVAS